MKYPPFIISILLLTFSSCQLLPYSKAKKTDKRKDIILPININTLQEWPYPLQADHSKNNITTHNEAVDHDIFGNMKLQLRAQVISIVPKKNNKQSIRFFIPDQVVYPERIKKKTGNYIIKPRNNYITLISPNRNFPFRKGRIVNLSINSAHQITQVYEALKPVSMIKPSHVLVIPQENDFGYYEDDLSSYPIKEQPDIKPHPISIHGTAGEIAPEMFNNKPSLRQIIQWEVESDQLGDFVVFRNGKVYVFAYAKGPGFSDLSWLKKEKSSNEFD